MPGQDRRSCAVVPRDTDTVENGTDRFSRARLGEKPWLNYFPLEGFSELEEALKGILSGISDALNRPRTIKNPRLGTVPI